MNFAEIVKKEFEDVKETENGARVYSSVGNDLLDLFGTIGALRPRTEKDIEEKFAKAFEVNSLLATKLLFYAGDIRGGLGERRTFRICLRWLALNHTDIVIKNMRLIPHFNRWDSLFVLVDTPAEDSMWDYVKEQLQEDFDASFLKHSKRVSLGVSLLAKWMPSETASSKKTKELAKKAMKKLSLSPRAYRKLLSSLRSHIDVVESKMSNNEWDAIEYKKVPSYAMKNYSKAFFKHDEEGFNNFLSEVQKGKVKINSSTLYPYDLVKKANGFNPVVEEQWKALPNYVPEGTNILVMADVSGSMCGRPMNTSIGLAIYFAQRATSDYHNLFMTFSSDPKFVALREGASLYENIRKVDNTDWGFTTNLGKAFKYILNFSVQHNVKPEDMPKALVVISDMEIDKYMRQDRLDFVDAMKTLFEEKGYELPKLVLFNVEARNDTFLSKQEGVLLVSGQSASIFKRLCGDLSGKTAYDLMLEVLNDSRYDCVQ